MVESQAADQYGSPKRNFWLWSAAFVAVFAFLFYQSVNYVGLMQVFAEWQFSRFGRYFPVLSVVGILMLLYLSWETMRYILRRGWRKQPVNKRAERSIAAIDSGALFFRCATVLGLILAMGTAIQWFQQPSSRNATQKIDLASRSSAAIRPGPVDVSGIRVIGPIARYSEDFLFIRRTRYLAPIGRGNGGDRAFNLFVEVPSNDLKASVPSRMTGVVRIAALMPEIGALYARARMPVSDKSAIIFATSSSANRPFVVLMIELLSMSMLAALFARYFQRSAEKQRDERLKAEV